MNLVTCLHTRDTLCIDPLRRVRSHIHGKINELVPFNRRIHGLIQSAPIKNTRLFFQIRPYLVKRQSLQEGVVLWIEGRGAIPNPKGYRWRHGLNRPSRAYADERKNEEPDGYFIHNEKEFRLFILRCQPISSFCLFPLFFRARPVNLVCRFFIFLLRRSIEFSF